MNKDVDIAMREWWLGELGALTEKVMKQEEKRQERERAKGEKALGEYRSYADIQDAYGCGAITERQYDRLMDALEKRNIRPDSLYEAKLELLQEEYQEQNAILVREKAFREAEKELAK